MKDSELLTQFLKYCQVFWKAPTPTDAMRSHSVGSAVSWSRVEVPLQGSADPARHSVPSGQPGILKAYRRPSHQIIYKQSG